MSELELDPTLLATLRALEEHDVELVVVGEVAAAIHDNGGFVSAVAIVPGPYGRNVDRLREALFALDAQLGIAGRPDERALDLRRADLHELAPCTFMTNQADIDLNFEPAGTRGYRDLFDDASRIRLAPGVSPLVASPEDLQRIARGTAPLLPPAQAPAILPPEPGGTGPLWADEQFRASRA
ncbi:MAG TPA: hypothetical protein VGO80_02980 [Solirubrobacteraceae bacterium]|nr:hypothetical protein [Solirubrobacteraceae bacterium]